MDEARRPCVITGNWKMHKTLHEAQDFVKDLLACLKPGYVKAGLAVPFTAIYPLAQMAEGSLLAIGAQNMNDASEGAFTGEIAGIMLKDAGAQFVLLGHSERRRLYHEDDQFINRKIKRAVQDGLQAVLCVGESKEEYEANQTHEVIERQLTEGLKDLNLENMEQITIAYEPLWAIGNGHSATPEIAQEVHAFCRQILAKLATEEIAQRMVIQYGGSVNPSNAHELLAQPDIDGLLIGGASLSLESFLKIVNDRYSKIQSEG